MSIRAALAIVMVGLAVIASGAAACLMIFTSRIDRETQTLSSATEGIRIADSLEITLLRYARGLADAGVAPGHVSAEDRGDVETLLHTQFDAAAAAADTPRERDLVAIAKTEVEKYLNAGTEPIAQIRLTAALQGLGDLAAFNLAQAESAGADAARWNRLSDVAGLIVSILIVLGTAASLAWLQAAAFRPLFRLRDAIARSTLAHETRAPEDGPSEVRTIAHAFNEMRDRLDAQRERQLTFIAAIVHELRNPMTPLKLASGQLIRQPDLAHAERVSRVVARQVEQLERITTDLLDAVRIEAGDLRLERTRCDLRSVATAVSELFCGDGFSRVQLELPASPVWSNVDAVRIQQVITNLVGNGLKYSPAGEPVSVRVFQDNGAAVVQIEDRGVGIEPEDLPHIFEPFQRAAHATHGIPGIGLGLSISRRIVMAHGGRLEVRSVAQAGSTFTVTLPADATA
ncbi:MAG TPA: HAMP domain-containing sensor histidine kinase [Vicinamibacterales bacterium]|jgi:two-component system sensor histidine kinase MtrB|nr:HAMP domain-containing sensor histidine kinase [Vicinamibacterales bacterium]